MREIVLLCSFRSACEISPGPPVFTSNSPLEITSSLGKYFEEEINAYDPDKQLINFKLLYPQRDTKWLQIKSQTNDSNGSTVTIGGVVPWEEVEDGLTL